MTPSKYQTAIYKAFQLTKRDINISAVARKRKNYNAVGIVKVRTERNENIVSCFQQKYC